MKLKIHIIPWYLTWRGLIWEKPKAIRLQTRFGIHTFFMNYPIDVAILNDRYEIIKLKRNLSPNRLFFWNPFFNTVLELPKGTIEKMKLKIGQTLTLETL